MKTAIGIVICVVLGFGAMQVALRTQGAGHVDEPEEKPATVEAPKPEERRALSATPVKTQKASPPASTKTASAPPPTKSAAKATPSKNEKPPIEKPSQPGMHFRAGKPNKYGIPSLIYIHNTPIWTCKILMLNTETAKRDPYIAKGAFKGYGKDHPWQVFVLNGKISVLFDGKNVQQAD